MPENKNKDGFIPEHGGYRNLITYQKSEVIYDGTVYFTKRFFQKYDRTIDQMVQAARRQSQISAIVHRSYLATMKGKIAKQLTQQLQVSPYILHWVFEENIPLVI